MDDETRWPVQDRDRRTDRGPDVPRRRPDRGGRPARRADAQALTGVCSVCIVAVQGCLSRPATPYPFPPAVPAGASYPFPPTPRRGVLHARTACPRDGAPVERVRPSSAVTSAAHVNPRTLRPQVPARP